jgi:hypothetical protein
VRHPRAAPGGDVIRISKPMVALALALGMFLGGTALAATVHSTSIKLTPNKTVVQKGHKVKFNGTLKSNFKKCRSWRKVTLYRNGHEVASKKTTQAGTFKFVRKVNHTKTWQVRFGGRNGGVHPNQYVCKGSHSKAIKVRVKH